MDLVGKFAFLLGFLGSVARDVLPPSLPALFPRGSALPKLQGLGHGMEAVGKEAPTNSISSLHDSMTSPSRNA